jgi:adenylate cyclase
MMAYGTRLYPSLALQAALVHSGAEFSQVRINPWELSLVGLPGNRRVRVPLDGTGCLWVLVPGPLESSFTGLSVSQLLNGQVPDLRGKAVVVGLAASGQTDMHPAPGVGQIPGIAVHASVLSGLLGGQVIQVLRWPWVALATVGLALSAVAAVRVCRPAIGALAGVALCAALAAAATAGFCRWDVWLNPVPAALAGGVSVLLALAVSYAASETRKRDIRRTLGRYLSPRILDELLRSAGSVAAVPRRKELTVFFSDIRSFTAIAERLEPEDLAELLRLYVERMADIAHRCDGTIDKFIGDGMMVFFGDPVAQPDHAERCVRMALAMQQAVAELNLELTRRGLPAIGVGMGINTGYATVGSLGSTRFASYTALGRTVNIAARLADLAEAGQILCGERTARLAGAPYACRPLGDMALRHVERPVPVYAVAVPEGTDGHAAAQGAAGG